MTLFDSIFGKTSRHRRHLPSAHTTSTNPPTSFQPDSGSRNHPYLSRSLSAQIEAIRKLFPDHVPHAVLQQEQQQIYSTAGSHARPATVSHFRNLNDTLFSSIDDIVTRDIGQNQSRPVESPSENAKPSHSQGKPSSSSTPVSIWSPILKYEERTTSLSRKPHITNLRIASSTGHNRSCSSPTPCSQPHKCDQRRRYIRCSDLNKPLPALPLEIAGARAIAHPISPRSLADAPSHPDPQRPDQHTSSNATHYTRWSPAVTHETITRRTHEVLEQRILREVQQDHFYHRVLPIVEVELLPTRHFVRHDNGYCEVAEDEVPDELRPAKEVLLAEALAQLKAQGLNGLEEEEDVQPDFPPAGRHEKVDARDFTRTQSTTLQSRIIRPVMTGVESTYSIHLHVDDPADR